MSAPKLITVPVEPRHDALYLIVSVLTAEHEDYKKLAVGQGGNGLIVDVQRKDGPHRRYLIPAEGLLRACMKLADEEA